MVQALSMGPPLVFRLSGDSHSRSGGFEALRWLVHASVFFSFIFHETLGPLIH